MLARWFPRDSYKGFAKRFLKVVQKGFLEKFLNVFQRGLLIPKGILEGISEEIPRGMNGFLK